MKKSLKYIAILAVGTSALVGCTSITDYPDGRLEFEDIFQNPKLVGGYINSAYVDAVSSYSAMYGDQSFLASACDEACDVDDATNGSLYQWNMGYLTPFDTPWEYPGDKARNPEWNYYMPIRRCNIMVDRVETATIRLESDRDAYRGDARGLRSYYYMRLLKAYGGVPLVLDNATEAEDDWSGATKASFAKVARQIIKDSEWILDENYTGLGWFSGSTDQSMCRWNKAMSAAMLSQAALFAASPLNYDASDPDAIDWAEAAELTKRALDLCLAHGYKLFQNQPTNDAANYYYNPYDYFFASTIDTKGAVDTESIMYGRTRMSIWRYCGLPTTDGQNRAGSCPSQELIDSYEMTNGEMPILGYADEDHLNPIINPNSDYDPKNPYANRDPRLIASVYYHGVPKIPSKTGKNDLFIDTSDDGNCSVSATDVRHTRTGYYMRKFSDPRSSGKGNYDGWLRYCRLAELYLNYAEAANEAAAGTAPNEAVDAVNAIRARVGMPQLPYGMSKDDFRTRVRNERRVELAYEGVRFYDVRRWKILDQTDKVVTGMKPVVVDNVKVGTDDEGQDIFEPVYDYERFVVQRRNAYTDKFYRLPIPGNEVARLINQTGIDMQNPGW